MGPILHQIGLRIISRQKIDWSRVHVSILPTFSSMSRRRQQRRRCIATSKQLVVNIIPYILVDFANCLLNFLDPTTDLLSVLPISLDGFRNRFLRPQNLCTCLHLQCVHVLQKRQSTLSAEALELFEADFRSILERVFKFLVFLNLNLLFQCFSQVADFQFL